MRHIYKFGPFCLDPNERVLLRDGELVRIPSKSFKALLVLVENSGHVVARDELVERIWRNTFVEESNLTQQVFTLRKALGADQNGHQYIETVPKLGYRFIGRVSTEIETRENASNEDVAEPRTTARNTLTRDTAIESIAVLPLYIPDNDSITEYLSRGIPEQIISNLAQLPRLRVRALSTVLKYSSQEMDP